MQAEQADADAATTTTTTTTTAATTTQAPSSTPLFGGALAASFPSRLADVSLARPVPDHQEVFSDLSRDQALVIEVLEHSEGVPDGEEAARYYFDDLVEQNEASQGARLNKVEALKEKSCSSSSSSSASAPLLLRGLAASPAPPSLPSASTALDACSYAALAVGTASISKGRSSGPPGGGGGEKKRENDVSLALALLRFPAVGSDLLVSLTTATALGDSGKSSAVVPAEEVLLEGRDPALVAAEAERLLLAVVASLEVRDWGLFG